MSKFQIIVISIFTVIGILAVLIFSGIIPGFQGGGSDEQEAAKLVFWGSFPEQNLRVAVSDFNDEYDPLEITYFQKSEENYESELLEALASGAGPDIWIISQNLLLKHKNKIFPLPFSSFSEREFRDSFADGFGIFLDGKNQNIIAVPFAADPLVLYWNRDIFSSEGVAKPPQYWDEFLITVQNLAKLDQSGNIIQAGAGIGEFKNVRNAKEIISTLILQTGNPIVIENDKGRLESVLNQKQNQALNPAENAIRFFNEFSNPNKSSYTWNKALTGDQTMFANGSLAMYFGYASEYEQIKKKNPHLNFDVAEIPQIRDGQIKTTYAKVYALAVSKNSQQANQAFSAINYLSGGKYNQLFAESLGLGPARRDLLSAQAKTPILSVVYKSSVMFKTWLDPDNKSTYQIFKDMVESTATGRMRIYDAVSSAQAKLRDLLSFYVE